MNGAMPRPQQAQGRMCGTPIIGQVDANVAARGGVHERDRGPVDKADLGVEISLDFLVDGCPGATERSSIGTTGATPPSLALPTVTPGFSGSISGNCVLPLDGWEMETIGEIGPKGTRGRQVWRAREGVRMYAELLGPTCELMDLT
eukprot:scaffold141906_cov31-Tisochrysis_lutea.AAC.4